MAFTQVGVTLAWTGRDGTGSHHGPIAASRPDTGALSRPVDRRPGTCHRLWAGRAAVSGKALPRCHQGQRAGLGDRIFSNPALQNCAGNHHQCGEGAQVMAVRSTGFPERPNHLMRLSPKPLGSRPCGVATEHARTRGCATVRPPGPRRPAAGTQPGGCLAAGSAVGGANGQPRGACDQGEPPPATE